MRPMRWARWPSISPRWPPANGPKMKSPPPKSWPEGHGSEGHRPGGRDPVTGGPAAGRGGPAALCSGAGPGAGNMSLPEGPLPHEPSPSDGHQMAVAVSTDGNIGVTLPDG